MTWEGWLIAYLVVGLLNGELSIVATRRAGTRLNGWGYVFLTLCWLPLVLAVLLRRLLKKGN